MSEEWKEWAQKVNEDVKTDKIREDIKVNLTDNEYEDIKKYAYKAGFETVGKLLSSFVGDLTGWHSNGSDERDYADRWYERAFGSCEWHSYLRYFLYEEGYSLDDMGELLNDQEYLDQVYEDYKDFSEKKEMESLEETRRIIEKIIKIGQNL